MATATKNYPPNDLSRREQTRKKSQCQLCRTKVPLKDQYTVENDLDANKVVKKKNAERKGAETMSHYCSDCAEKRVTQKQAWLDQRNGSAPKKASKPKAAKKATAKKAKTTSRKTKKGRSAKTGAKRKAKAETASDPF